ncbi:MAG: type II secretion system protein [Bdellovibrionales bacterium]
MACFKRSTQSGFSLLETTIVIAILTVVLSTAFTVLILMQETYFRTAQDLSDISEKSLGERAVWLNLLNAGASFNNVNQLDDNGLQFFDLLPDYPSKLIPGPDSNRTRTVTLNAIGESINFLLFDKRTDPPVYYDATHAYTYTTSGNVSLPGTMTFGSLNRNNYLDNLNNALFRPNNMLMVYSPVALRAPGAAMVVPPRFAIYTGRVVGAGLPADTGGGVIRNTHPVNGAVLNNLDTFFRTAPPQGSPNQIIFVAGVQLIRYRLQAVAASALLQRQAQAGGMTLQRQVWRAGAWTLDTPIAVGVTQVIFRRETLSIPTITADLRFNY